jgi:hypothetical protein
MTRTSLKILTLQNKPIKLIKIWIKFIAILKNDWKYLRKCAIFLFGF